MADIMLAYNSAINGADWVIANGTVQTGDDLETAIVFSLFTWRRDLPYGQYGWWGDTYETYPTGSRLPEMLRAFYNSEAGLIVRLNDIINECLAWLVTEGVVASFDITSTFVSRSAVSSTITAHRPDSSKQTFRFDWSWRQLIAAGIV